MIDAVSWRIVLPELRAAYAAAASGREIRLEPEATSFRRWARLLNDAATDPELLAGLPAWQDMTKVSEPLLGDRGLNPEVDTVGRSHCLTVQVAPEVSELVLTRLTRAYHTGANEVLLTALALALMHRRVMRGESDGAVLVNLEGHGRESLAPWADVSRTVGWFTALYPVCLIPGVRDWTAVWRADAVLKSIKEQLSQVPACKAGYGLLRYLNPATQAALNSGTRPQVAFNYLGRIKDISLDGWILRATRTNGRSGMGAGEDAGMPCAHALEIDAYLVDAKDNPASLRLVSEWRWPGDLLAESDVRSLAEGWQSALAALAVHAQSPGVGGHSPSDMPLIDMSQDEIDEFDRLLNEEDEAGS